MDYFASFPSRRSPEFCRKRLGRSRPPIHWWSRRIMRGAATTLLRLSCVMRRRLRARWARSADGSKYPRIQLDREGGPMSKLVLKLETAAWKEVAGRQQQ